ncbi:MAG: diguanylate cyclase [Solirubrobacterales bacterium]
MSFRRRLTFFFVLIVVLPMVALGALVIQVAGSSQTGKADARLSSALETGLSIYRTELTEAEQAARDAATDPRLASAIRSEDAARARSEATRIVRDSELASLVVLGARGSELASVGAGDNVAEAELRLRQGGGEGGSLLASTTTAISYVGRVRELTGRNATVIDDRGTVATTIPVGEAALPPAGGAETLEIGGDSSDAVPFRRCAGCRAPEELRAASAGLGEEQRLVVFGEIEAGGFAATRPLVAAALAAFFLIALFFIAMLMRSLQGQIEGMLAAARRIGSGDFSRKLPVEGNDEMAGLAREFNNMSEQLSAQMDELRRQRSEIDQSVRRIGEAFASGLDRKALLEIVAETAASACNADHARIVLAGGEPEVAVGKPLSPTMLEVARAAERTAMRDGLVAEAEEAEEGEAFALSCLLRSGAEHAGDEATEVDRRAWALGGAAMTIVREGKSFDAEQRDVFRYLIGQAVASIENVELHEMVAEQAITDELTGLPNNRRFRNWIGNETARAQRFGHDLSLLMLDIDDFKKVNDTHGHLQGDEVLRVIGRVLLEESRGVDEPARYGGEEFAIGLPETNLEGAVEFAERVRERIADTEIAMVDGDGAIQLTMSVGAAAAPAGGADARTLIAASDQALYRAKRSGKNRTERGKTESLPGDRREGKGPRTAKIRSDG